MSDPQATRILQKALLGIMVLHVICAVGLMMFSVYFHQRLNRLDSPDMRHKEEAVLLKIKAEPNLEVLRKQAITGWKQAASTWRHFLDALKILDRCIVFLCLLPIMTAAVALHALYSFRRQRAADSVADSQPSP
jgi:hypothetical protein